MNEMQEMIKKTYTMKIENLIPEDTWGTMNKKEKAAIKDGFDKYGVLLGELFTLFLQGLSVSIPEQSINPAGLTVTSGTASRAVGGSASLSAHTGTITWQGKKEDT